MATQTKRAKKDQPAQQAVVAKDYRNNLPFDDWVIVLGLTVLAAVVRLWKIDYPTSVVFDEVHFGGFATKYIKGKFFMDVHPPLAKLLIALTAWLAGFDGEFDFKEIGKDYLEPGVPYVAMRLLPATLGILVVPIIYLTLRSSGATQTTGVLGACLILFENGLVTQSRLILLDSPLVICTAFTAYAWTVFGTKYHGANLEGSPAKNADGTPSGNLNDHAFSPDWWLWLSLTGFGLGATVSMKWVGLFTIAWVGVTTIFQLWNLLGDLRVTPRMWAKHFFARVLCLIILPVGFYMAMFGIHFLCLVNPGEGDGFMSSEFQQSLNSKRSEDTFADVAFGSTVTIRHLNTQGGYLHSHIHTYPGGSNQQQITLYPHRDDNNLWILTNQTDPENGYNSSAPVFIEDGAVIRLEHVITEKRLHSHDVRPPVSEVDWQNEVSGYGFPGFEGDANDWFRVEIIKPKSVKGVARERVRAIDTKFRLVHVMSGCSLFSHRVKLPDWGFEQQEVTCARGGTLPNSIWYIESNTHPTLPPESEKVNYRIPDFFSRFWELHVVMWRTNAGLVESHAWDSRPLDWPWLRRGINFWGKDHRQVYLIGNPIVWWTSTLALVIYAAVKAFSILRWQRGYKDYSNPTWRHYDWNVGVAVLGWGLHYLPFFLMKRQLFLHHYFPALYFAVIALCQEWDFLTTRSRFTSSPRRAPQLTLIFIVVVVAVFVSLSPLAYGGKWTKSSCEKARFFKTWDFDCPTFYDDYESYNKKPLSAVGPTTPAVSGGVLPLDSPVPVHYQDSDEGVIIDPSSEGEDSIPELHAGRTTPRARGAAMRYEEVVYKDEFGNIIPEEQLSKLLEEQGENIEFRTIYETQTKILKPGEEPPKGARRIPVENGKRPGEQEVRPVYPEGVNPETEEGEKKAYKTA